MGLLEADTAPRASEWDSVAAYNRKASDRTDTGVLEGMLMVA